MSKKSNPPPNTSKPKAPPFPPEHHTMHSRQTILMGGKIVGEVQTPELASQADIELLHKKLDLLIYKMDHIFKDYVLRDGHFVKDRR